MAALRSAVAEEQRRLRRAAALALESPRSLDDAFEYLASLDPSPEEGIVLFENAQPLAWSGRVVVDPTPAAAPLSVSVTPFYTTMTATAQRGPRRAVATAILHAEPPADRLSAGLDSRISGRDEIESFTFAPGSDTGAGQAILAVNGATALRADAIPLPRAMVQFDRVATARAWGTILFGLGLLALLAVAWRDRKLLGQRLFAIGVCAVAVGIVPWNSLRSEERRVGKECRSRWSPYDEKKKRTVRPRDREDLTARTTRVLRAPAEYTAAIPSTSFRASLAIVARQESGSSVQASL